MKKRGKQRSKKPLNRHLDGFTMCFNDTDPIGDPNPDSITQLPYKHENAVLNLRAADIFKLNVSTILNDTRWWQISFTPISILNGPMAETVIVQSKCKISEITGTVESYIEEVMQGLDMDFYSHFNFECKVGGRRV